MQTRTVQAIAHAIRLALAAASPRFPTLHCEDASALLWCALSQTGEAARVVRGRFRLDKPVMQEVDDHSEGLSEWFGHAWVEVEGTVIDITGDQFNPGLTTPTPPVYIGSRTDRYVDGAVKDSAQLLQSPLCQAVMQELLPLFGRLPVGAELTDGLTAADFTWWERRHPQEQQAFLRHLEDLGRRVGTALAAAGSDLTYRATGRIRKGDQSGWVTWAPASFGDDVAYRKRPHITLDSTRRNLAVHLNLELADNANHFADMVRQDAAGVLMKARRLGCGLELQIYQRRHLQAQKWELEHPAGYCVDELTAETLLEAVRKAEAWGRVMGSRQAYFFSQHIPAARVIALGPELGPDLVRRIERLRAGLTDFDWRH